MIVTAHEMLATLESKDGDCTAAAEHFELAADAIATHPESLEAYGYCLFELKQFDKAVPVFEQLVSLLPDRSYPKYDLALVLVSAKQYETAIKALEPLLTEDQKDPDILSLASQAYEATKNTPRAVASVAPGNRTESHDAQLLRRVCSSLSRARLFPGRRRHDERWA